MQEKLIKPSYFTNPMDTISIETTRKYQLVDITEKVKKIVAKANIEEGICTVYTPHATAAIIINENYDPNVMEDVIQAMQNLIPEGKWQHDMVDNNGAAHIKSAIIGPSETIPIAHGKLALGQWQDIMFADFDGPRSERTVYVSIQ